MSEKICSKCIKKLPLSSFEIDSGYTRNVCRSCRLIQSKEATAKLVNATKIVPDAKKCRRCEKVKLSTEFNKRSIFKDGLAKECRECFSKFRHRKKSEIVTKQIIILTCDKCLLSKPNTMFRSTLKSTTGHFKTCNDCWKPIQWNSEKQKAAEKKYVKNNPEKIRAKWKKAGDNINRKIRDRLNHRIADAFKSLKTRKANKTVNYIGCSIEYLKKWFEFQFDDKIGWVNYGDWHIDHVTPCSYQILKTN